MTLLADNLNIPGNFYIIKMALEQAIKLITKLITKVNKLALCDLTLVI